MLTAHKNENGNEVRILVEVALFSINADGKGINPPLPVFCFIVEHLDKYFSLSAYHVG